MVEDYSKKELPSSQVTPPDPYKLKKDQFFEIGMFCINMMKHSKGTIISRILSVKNTGFLDANLLQFHFHIT